MRKVLIISYYWPPAGGVSVHRALKWAKFLPQFGWIPIIYTAENAQYPFIDKSYEAKIPEGLNVIKHRITEVQSAFKILSGRKKDHALVSPFQVRNKKSERFDAFAVWIRSNFFIPDARMLWIKPSVKYLKKYLSDNDTDAVISTGPPHSSNMIGLHLHKAAGVPWIADFQDPWTQVDYYKLLKLLPRSDKKHKRMEREIFASANGITTVSKTWAEDMGSIGAENVVPLYFGFDADDFTDIKSIDDGYFGFLHAGMLGFDRLPETLFEVLSELVSENEFFSEKLKIRLAGMIDYSVNEMIEKYNLAPYTELLGNISLDHAYRLTFSSQILLLLLNKADNAGGRIPGKLFEYLASGKPILCLGPVTGDSAKIIEQTSSGFTTEYDDKAGIKNFIVRKFNRFVNNEPLSSTKNIDEFSVKTQTEILANLLNKIVK